MSTRERLAELFRVLFGDDIAVTEATTAADIDGWDSVAHINLLFLVEQTFGIEFADDEFTTLVDVGDLERTIERKLEGRRDRGR